MEIRPLNTRDNRAELSRVYEESWKYAYRNIVPQAYLDSIPSGHWANRIEGRANLVLLDGGRIVGTASYAPSRCASMEGYGEIISLYLLPEVMGRGHGARLLRAAMAGLKRMGFEKAFLWVLEENLPARRFYQRNGFAFSGKRTTLTISGKTLQEMQYISQL